MHDMPVHTKLKNEDLTEQYLSVFESLFATYYDSLWGYAYKVVDDRQAAEDIVQDVFMAVWERRNLIDFSSSLKPYLFKAVYNRSLTHLNAEAVLLCIDEDIPELLLDKGIISNNGQDLLITKEISREIALFTESLPQQCRKVFKLSRNFHLKNREIAEMLGISEKTVEGHISKALKGLREHLMRVGLLSIHLFFYLLPEPYFYIL